MNGDHRDLRAAMRDARLPILEERGLMPLAEARDLLAGTTVFTEGKGRMVDGTFVLESDRVWAALLSLEDAAEFVPHARRLRRRAIVRGACGWTRRGRPARAHHAPAAGRRRLTPSSALRWGHSKSRCSASNRTRSSSTPSA
jgi:hypothetical protein